MADYGLLITNELVKNSSELMKTEEIANLVQLPLTTVRKILQHLVDAQIVQSFRGINGGYRLARMSHTINIAEVIIAIEGPIAITECSVAHGSCNMESHCHLKDNWSYINFVVDQILHKITLADMAKSMDKKEMDITRILNRIEEPKSHDMQQPS